MTNVGLGEHIRVASTEWTEAGGYIATRELLSNGPRPTAIFAGADVAAIGALRAVFEAGLRVPQDISVVGYDNTGFSSLHPVSLTSVDQSGRIMGASAARLLLERIAGRDRGVNLSIAPYLIPRSSSGTVPA